MRTFGLIGKQLGHSFSRKYFTEKFQLEGIDAAYHNFELGDISQLRSFLSKHPHLEGFNVTIPYKEKIIPFLDHVEQDAASIGAVNTVKISNGIFTGYNSDVHGFRESLKPFLAHGMEYALVLGTGGASKAVASVLRKLGITVSFATRNPKAENHLAYTELNEYAMRTFKLIINTTPLGTWPETDEKPPIPYQHITNQHFLYDLVYNPPVTAFMREATQRGAGTTGGLTMLKLQAEKSWEIWNKS
jgi:shikimate dehydrogenase